MSRTTPEWMAASEVAIAEGRREQTCPDCGRREAAGGYCTGCLLPMHPSAWHLPERSPKQEQALQKARERRLLQPERPESTGVDSDATSRL